MADALIAAVETVAAKKPPQHSSSTSPALDIFLCLSIGGNGSIMYSGNEEDDAREDGILPSSFSRANGFRTPLEMLEMPDWERKGKKRESRAMDDSWNPLRWLFHDSSQDDRSAIATTGAANEAEDEAQATDKDKGAAPGAEPGETRSRVYRSSTSPEIRMKTAPKWARLRSLMPHIASQAHKNESQPPSSVTPATVNITDELITGGLSTLMLRMWFERDEKDDRRIPVLFHRLASLRDLISLHTHYAFSNAYNRNVDDLPEFPKTSLPYFKFLKKEGKDIGAKDFARIQRDNLETYLINLIAAVMFHPAANRLASFLEISALFVNLANSGGLQLKAGYLQIESTKTGGGFGRKSATWRERKEPKWCSVRDSYIVAVQEPGELTVWDVFLLDADFEIERPRRYYRQGLKFLHPNESESEDEAPDGMLPDERIKPSVMGSIRRSISRIARPSRRDQNGNEENHSSPSSGSSAASDMSAEPVAMQDPSTHVDPMQDDQSDVERDWHPDELEKRKRKQPTAGVSKHTFFIVNSQQRLKLFARNQRQMKQWITALEKVKSSPYCQPNRFDSFSPIRLNVAAQWLVDGRDYFWNLSRALLLARESIYIHDWWLSPELQLRRPNKDRYRLDRLLERKAKEGVKIYVILYQEVSSRTTPTDSNYAKQRLTSLHPNILVQRSPSHFQTGTFYWAHHEKMCVIDQTIAFMGGFDLCFGRNPRVVDFHTLNKPEEDMYDRSKVPRMPWHDVGLQVVGQPARDLCRHFVQRWNYLLRNKNHTRIMPFLLPPPEFKVGELTAMQLTGTCEMQICRSAGPWSLGTKKTEHSIQNAYLKGQLAVAETLGPMMITSTAIQLSEHFVYIENQFFITSTVVNDQKIENRIGDAIVQRIIRAHHDGMPWRCCIVIPLLPGFTFPVDHGDASAIRIILECQNRTIARGPNSIFARLRKEGIDPDEYISIFSLRSWGKLPGDILTTEQLYIHGKVCVVDDRLVIIGSANINERSQRGDRDSELAAVIRDTDMIDGTMAGKPFQVGRFAHSLRVRLMREHLGVDVDSLDEEHLMAREPSQPEHEQEKWIPETEDDGYVKESRAEPGLHGILGTVNGIIKQGIHGSAEASSHTTSKLLKKIGLVDRSTAQNAGDDALIEERMMFDREGNKEPGFASAIVPTLEEKMVLEHRPAEEHADGTPIEERVAEGVQENDSGNAQVDDGESKPEQPRTEDGDLFGAPADASQDPKTDDQPPHARSNVDDATDEERTAPHARSLIRRHLAAKLGSKTWALPVPRPKVDKDAFEDPICDQFWKEVWVSSAAHNVRALTEIYRKVFHAIPDDLITTWKQYKEFIVHHERLNKPPRDAMTPEAVAVVPSETAEEGAAAASSDGRDKPNEEDETTSEGHASDKKKEKTSQAGPEPFERWERDEMEKLLGQLNGHLVLYPNRFLEGEDVANNFLFNSDRLLPLPIYD
ncbi:unnamed protein product [Mycena citricolor]|uniref:Phospholipase n=1 Tax=Mycena citricolor TaxID=2018698 RepID=A0AAD2K865_9AGAR|nr:unnamed protein product [Mycena citricolor]